MEPVSWRSTFAPPATPLTRRLLVYFTSGRTPLCCPAPFNLWNHSGEAVRGSGISLILFGLIAESVFTFIPESCSESSRNAVRNHRGIAFNLVRIPQLLIGNPDHTAPAGCQNGDVFGTFPVPIGTTSALSGLNGGRSVARA